ncbi:12825_t:CDS:2, partial [Dentiscutata heterogama]
EANEIKYDLTKYGDLVTVRQYDDGKLLIVTSRKDDPELLHLVYQNGSISTINYQDSINFKNSSAWIIEDSYNDISKSFIITYKKSNDLKWIKYAFSKIDGIATPISNGSIKSPRDGYNLSSYIAFSAIGSQHVIVYLVTNNTSVHKDDYRYPSLAIYAHFVKDGLDPLSEQFLLHESYN